MADGHAKGHGMHGAKLALLLLLASVGCRTDPLIGEYNEVPVADAKVIVQGMAMEQTRDGSIAGLNFPFTGEPVTVVLDGTASHDPDGEIVGYRWLSGTRIPDAGAPLPWSLDAGVPAPFWRSVPADQALPWPSAVAAPSVQLGQGTWTFSLWVVDDRGAWSNPDTIRFTIGAASTSAGDAGTLGATGMVRLDAGMDGGR